MQKHINDRISKAQILGLVKRIENWRSVACSWKNNVYYGTPYMNLFCHGYICKKRLENGKRKVKLNQCFCMWQASNVPRFLWNHYFLNGNRFALDQSIRLTKRRTQKLASTARESTSHYWTQQYVVAELTLSCDCIRPGKKS